MQKRDEHSARSLHDAISLYPIHINVPEAIFSGFRILFRWFLISSFVHLTLEGK